MLRFQTRVAKKSEPGTSQRQKGRIAPMLCLKHPRQKCEQNQLDIVELDYMKHNNVSLVFQ